jgi:hypothetical protein
MSSWNMLFWCLLRLSFGIFHGWQVRVRKISHMLNLHVKGMSAYILEKIVVDERPISLITHVNQPSRSQNKNHKCGGKWGSCCSAAGKCGTGEKFCGVNKCQSGNCTMIIPSWTTPEVSSTLMPVAVPTPTVGSISPDGSCGLVKTIMKHINADANRDSGTNKFVCKGSKLGDCCSSPGFCGSTTAHCVYLPVEQCIDLH